MSILQELEKQYFEIDNQYAVKEFEAHSKGFNKKEDYWKRKRELNDHAYFLFLFTRLEEHIKTNSIDLITGKQSSISHWKTRAIWDITERDKLYFKKRVALLTERGRSDYNQIISYYDLRNDIAHGGTVTNITTSVDMSDVFTKMKRYFRILKK